MKRVCCGQYISVRIICRFTLVELLVVIAIISVLAGLLLPALHLARQQALKASCASNLRQQNVAITMYNNDFNGWLPTASATFPVPTGSWCWQISPYLDFTWDKTDWLPKSGPAVFYCPSAKKECIYTWSKTFHLLSYGMSRDLIDMQYHGGVENKPIARITRPDLTLLIADLEFWHTLVPAYADGSNLSAAVSNHTWNSNCHYSADPERFTYRHADTCNFMYITCNLVSKRDRGDGFPSGFRFYGDGPDY